MDSREIHHSVVGLIATLALLLTGCSSGDPGPTGSGGPLPSGGPSATPSDSPTIGGFDRRDAGMTDLDALGRLVAPLTGETWYDFPVEIATPSWAVGDPYLDQEGTAWYELGIRGSSTIVGFKFDAVEEIFERTGDGWWEWIAFPSARDVITPTADTFGYDEVPTNTTNYYDSLTLPSTFTLPSGEPLLVPDFDWGSTDVPGNGSFTLADGEVVDQVGGYQVVRFAKDARWAWSDPYPVTKPEGLTYEEFFYALATPYGMVIPLEYAPIGELPDISWTISTSIATDAYTSLADINDVGCGPRDSDHNTTVFGTRASDWELAGTAPTGAKVYMPTATNPLTQPMYDVYTVFKEGFGETPVSLAGFIDGPALIGYKSPGSSDWVVFLNGAYSGRAWC